LFSNNNTSIVDEEIKRAILPQESAYLFVFVKFYLKEETVPTSENGDINWRKQG
jgi:hypothetical protein